MADPDLQIRGGGGGHPDPETTGERSQKKIFLALWASFWTKNMGGGGVAGPPGPSPGSTTDAHLSSVVSFHFCQNVASIITVQNWARFFGGEGESVYRLDWLLFYLSFNLVTRCN